MSRLTGETRSIAGELLDEESPPHAALICRPDGGSQLR
jgi:hypothetical protein